MKYSHLSSYAFYSPVQLQS